MDVSQGIAVVTGGAQGIGRAVCQTLLNKGCKVCCTDINCEKGNETLRELREIYGKENCIFIRCDVTSLDEFEASYLQARNIFGNVNILVNNAGVIKGRVVEVNMNGVINGCQIAFKYMGKNNGGNGGAVVNVTSPAGFIPCPYHPIYSAAKASVAALTRNYGHELFYEKSGIKFTAVSPVSVNTDTYLTATTESEFPEALGKLLDPIILSEPQAIGDAVVQLLEDGRNGEILSVSVKNGNNYLPFQEQELFF